MAKKIRRGLEGQLARGFHTGSKTYGYRTVPVLDPSGRLDPNGHPALAGKRLEVNPDEAAVVRRIFEWYVSGLGAIRITERLNREGHPAPRGVRLWRVGAVKRILTNERYRGLQVFGQHVRAAARHASKGRARGATRPVADR